MKNVADAKLEKTSLSADIFPSSAHRISGTGYVYIIFVLDYIKIHEDKVADASGHDE